MENKKRLTDVNPIIRNLTAMKSMYDAIALDGMIKAREEVRGWLERMVQNAALSATACAGILRRAERRGKELPEILRIALEQTIARESA